MKKRLIQIKEIEKFNWKHFGFNIPLSPRKAMHNLAKILDDFGGNCQIDHEKKVIKFDDKVCLDKVTYSKALDLIDDCDYDARIFH